MTTDIFNLRPDRWTEQAACVGEDPELWYPLGRSGRLGDPMREEPAKAICGGCPVRVRCLSAALEEEAGVESARYGIRGGLNEFERSALVADGAA